MDFKRNSLSFLCASLIFTCAAFTTNSPSSLSKSDRKSKKREHTLIIAPTDSYTTSSVSSHFFVATSSLNCFQAPLDFLPAFNFLTTEKDTLITQTVSTDLINQEVSNDIFALLDEEANEKTNQDNIELDIEEINSISFSAANNLIITPQFLEKVAVREDFVTSLVDIAIAQEGVRYVPGGKSPKGFDCSGFVSYVYSKLKINLPASSSSYDKVGNRVELKDAQVGDVICFTGRNSHSGRTGHVGIIIETNPNEPIKFIHAASGSRRQITYSTMESTYYKTRFRSVRRISASAVKENLEIRSAQ